MAPTVHVRFQGLSGCGGVVESSARHLVERVDGYLEVLAAHGVVCERVESTDPGRVLYEDEHQVVVVPHDQRRRATHSSR